MSARVAAVFDYEAQPMEYPEACNLCGSVYTVEPEDLGDDRYGYEVGAPECACGLKFLAPRMTAAAYSDFYASGAYRRLVSAYHGREINEKTIQPEQREYGRRLSHLLRAWIAEYARTLLDIGGSTGMVARTLAEALGVYPTVLDPAPYELEEVGLAYVHGLGVVHMTRIGDTIELADLGDRRWDAITLCQTIDHLLDPMGALRKIKAHLAPGGLFWVDALDYDRTRQIKIDHPYNFTEATLRKAVEKAGFEIVATSREVSADGNHIGFVCR